MGEAAGDGGDGAAEAAREARKPAGSGSSDGTDGVTRGQMLLALAIVVVSILAAAMEWRASVADDAAASAQQLAGQDRIERQQLFATDESSVLREILVFGSFEGHTNLGYLLTRAAQHGRGAAAHSLAARAQVEFDLARAESALFTVISPSVTGGVATYDVSAARTQELDTDQDLLRVQLPGEVEARAAALSTKGQRLKGLAVLLVAVLVLFTIAEVSDHRTSSRACVVFGVALAAAVCVLYLLV